MLLVTVLGTGDYQEATYQLQDGDTWRRCRTRLFPTALAEWFAPERVLVLLTPEALEHDNWQALQAFLGERAEPVLIPIGRNERELWDVFDALVTRVPAKARLLFDVTHGFRALPLFAVSAALFLHRVRGVTIERVLYGAYEARDAAGNAPVFDLTPLVDLIDWLSGIEALVQSGNGQLLAQRLGETQRRQWRRGNGHAKPRQLQRVGKALGTFSTAVQLNRPHEALTAARTVVNTIADAREELAHWVRPFALLAQEIADEVAAIAHHEPDRLTRANLQAQLALIDYALTKGLVLQAVTLAREWLVSWYILERFPENAERWLHPEIRDQAERALNNGARKLREGAAIAWQIPERRVFLLWDQLGQLRNDLAHCGMRPQNQRPEPEQVRARAEKLINQVRQVLRAV